jgi:hypothetical protein
MDPKPARQEWSAHAAADHTSQAKSKRRHSDPFGQLTDLYHQSVKLLPECSDIRRMQELAATGASVAEEAQKEMRRISSSAGEYKEALWKCGWYMTELDHMCTSQKLQVSDKLQGIWQEIAHISELKQTYITDEIPETETCQPGTMFDKLNQLVEETSFFEKWTGGTYFLDLVDIARDTANETYPSEDASQEDRSSYFHHQQFQRKALQDIIYKEGQAGQGTKTEEDKKLDKWLDKMLSSFQDSRWGMGHYICSCKMTLTSGLSRSTT